MLRVIIRKFSTAAGCRELCRCNEKIPLSCMCQFNTPLDKFGRLMGGVALFFGGCLFGMGCAGALCKAEPTMWFERPPYKTPTRN